MLETEKFHDCFDSIACISINEASNLKKKKKKKQK